MKSKKKKGRRRRIRRRRRKRRRIRRRRRKRRRRSKEDNLLLTSTVPDIFHVRYRAVAINTPFHNVHIHFGAHRAPIQWVLGFFPSSKAARA